MESPENLHGPAVGVGQDATPTTVDVDTAVFLLGAGVTTLTHPLLYVKLLIQHIVKVDGKRGLLRGLSPRIVSSAISTVVRSKVKQISTWTSWNIVLMLGVTNYLKSERKRTKTELHMLQRLIQKQRDSQ